MSTAEVIDPSKIIPFEKCSVDKLPFDVHKHIRNLAPGAHPSPEKVATALENGMELQQNQTWVKDYTKRLRQAA